MKQVVVYVGNCLVGDALWTWKHFRPNANEHITAFVIPYNRGAVEMLRDTCTLQIDAIEEPIVPDANIPFMGMGGYHDWCQKYNAVAPCDEARYFDGSQSLEPLPVRKEFQWGQQRPPTYVTMQIDSVHTWKRIAGIPEVVQKVGTPCYLIQHSGQLSPDVPIAGDCTNQPLVAVAQVLLSAQAHVGINSSISVLAALLGVPTVICGASMSSFTDVPPTVRLIPHGGDDLIEAALRNLLMVYNDPTISTP